MAKTSFKQLFKTRDNRYKALGILLIPVLVVTLVLGVFGYKQVKNLLTLVSDNPDNVAVDNKYVISSMGYVLRDNATEYQMTIFSELKEDIEKPAEGVTPEDIAGLVVKNYVADFYTWSNKIAQYDVGGLYYVNGEGRELVFTEARDTFYKHLNSYLEEYGAENLLEVENVEVSVKPSGKFTVAHKEWYVNENDPNDRGALIDVDEDYDAFDVTATWTYKQGGTFSTSRFQSESMFKVVFNEREARYEIVMAGQTLDVGDAQEVDE